MKPVSVRELRNVFPKLASSLEEGEEILLTRGIRSPLRRSLRFGKDITETVDWSTSAAFQLTRSGQVLSRERVEEVLAESKGDC